MKKILSMAFKHARTMLNGVLLLGLIFAAPSAHHLFLRKFVGGQVVKIMGKKSGGTGFHIQSPSGKVYLMTNAHICELADSNGYLKIYQNEEFIDAKKVIEISKVHDLCIMEPLEGKVGLRLSTFDIGELPLYILGHPRLTPLSVQKGEFIGQETIKLLDELAIKKSDCKSKSAPLPKNTIEYFMGFNYYCYNEYESDRLNLISYPGNSGSPIVTPIGTVLGVLFAKSAGMLTSSYSVPLSYVRDFLRKY